MVMWQYYEIKDALYLEFSAVLFRKLNYYHSPLPFFPRQKWLLLNFKISKI